MRFGSRVVKMAYPGYAIIYIKNEIFKILSQK